VLFEGGQGGKTIPWAKAWSLGRASRLLPLDVLSLRVFGGDDSEREVGEGEMAVLGMESQDLMGAIMRVLIVMAKVKC